MITCPIPYPRISTIQEAKSWTNIGTALIQYLLYRIRLANIPDFHGDFRDIMIVLGRSLKWTSQLHMIFTENCPKEHGAVYCSNHIMKDDPFITGASIFLASGQNVWVDYMMRDDFFAKWPKTRFFDPDEILGLFKARPISRGKVNLKQIRLFVNILKNGGSFLMYPGRTRSRSGLLMEYRDGFDDPAGPSFFINQLASIKPGLPTVPIARTFNPVNKRSTVAFGKPMTMPLDADRHTQRAFDFAVIDAIGNLIEIHAPHIIASILYLRALHGLHTPIDIPLLEEAVRRAPQNLPERPCDPAMIQSTTHQTRATLEFFARTGLIALTKNQATPLPASILNLPPIDANFSKINPIRTLTNQIIHLPDLIHYLESTKDLTALRNSC